MTRAQGPDSEIDYRVVGTPGATRTVVVLRTGALATSDPGPEETAGRDVCVVLVHLDGPELEDPPAFGGETPAASTISELRAIVDELTGASSFAVVGERDAGALAIALAADLGDRVDMLALVSVPVPEGALDRDLAEEVVARVSARTLLIGAIDDAACRFYGRALPSARVDEVDASQLTSPDGEVGLVDVWPRVLAHCLGIER
jgi:pimeloyl-ACP methyl ester carboxylesterase